VSLNAGVLTFSDGRVLIAPGGTVTDFNGGTPTDADGALVVEGEFEPDIPPTDPDDPDGPWGWDYDLVDNTLGQTTVVGSSGITSGALDLSNVSGNPAAQKYTTGNKGLQDVGIVGHVIHPDFDGTYAYGYVGRINNYTTNESYGFLVTETTVSIVRTTNNVNTTLATATYSLTDGVEYKHEITIIGNALTFKIYEPDGDLVVNLSATDYFYTAGQVAFKMTKTPPGSLGGLVKDTTITDLSPGGASGAWTWEPQSTTLMQVVQEGTPSVVAAGGSSLGAYDQWVLAQTNGSTAAWGCQELRAADIVKANGTFEAYVKLPAIPGGSPAHAGTALGVRCSNAASATYTGIVCYVFIEGVASGSQLSFYLQELSGAANVKQVGVRNNMNYASPIVAPGATCRITLTTQDEVITARLYSWPANALLLTLSMVSYLNMSTANLMIRQYRNAGGVAGDNSGRIHQAAFYEGEALDLPYSPSWGSGSLTAGSALTLGTPYGARNFGYQTLGTGEMCLMSADALPTTGKWYWEVQCDQVSSQLQDILGIGWDTPIALTSVACGESGHSTIHWLNGSTTSIGTAATTQWNGPARVGFAYDADALVLWVAIDGTYLLSGNPAAGTNPLFSALAQSPTPTTKPRRIWLRGAGDAVISYCWLYTSADQHAYAAPSGFEVLTRASGLANPYSPYTKTVLNLQGADGATSFPDAANSGNVWTALGNAQIDVNVNFPDGALLCDGTGDGISCPDTGDQFELPNWGFNCECTIWVDPAGAGTVRGIWGKRPTTASVQGHLLFIDTDNALHFLATGDNATWHINLDASLAVPTGQKVHVAVTRQGWRWNIWMNGVSVASVGGANSGSYGMLANASNLTVGCASADGGSSFRGWISNFRLIGGASLYNRAFVPPSGVLPALADAPDEDPPVVTPQIAEIEVHVGGLPYDANDALIVEQELPTSYVGGVGITSAGGVAVDTEGAITHYNAGLPYTAEGCLAVVEGSVEMLGAFSPDFSDEEFS
jgi:hypothetical protein